MTSAPFQRATSCRLVLILVFLFAGSCADTVCSFLRLRLQVRVVTFAGRPVEGLELWLKDRNFAPGEGPKTLRRPLGVTSSSGALGRSFDYRYCYASYSWEPYLKLRTPANEAFSLEARKGGRVLAVMPIPSLTRRQIGGYDPVDVVVRVADDAL